MSGSSGRGSWRKVDWVRWLGGPDVVCTRCDAKITLPSGCSIGALLAFMKAVCNDHARCEERAATPEPVEPHERETTP